jgi:hypothetical protein
MGLLTAQTILTWRSFAVTAVHKKSLLFKIRMLVPMLSLSSMSYFSSDCYELQSSHACTCTNTRTPSALIFHSGDAGYIQCLIERCACCISHPNRMPPGDDDFALATFDDNLNDPWLGSRGRCASRGFAENLTLRCGVGATCAAEPAVRNIFSTILARSAAYLSKHACLRVCRRFIGYLRKMGPDLPQDAEEDAHGSTTGESETTNVREDTASKEEGSPSLKWAELCWVMQLTIIDVVHDFGFTGPVRFAEFGALVLVLHLPREHVVC